MSRNKISRTAGFFRSDEVFIISIVRIEPEKSTITPFLLSGHRGANNFREDKMNVVSFPVLISHASSLGLVGSMISVVIP